MIEMKKYGLPILGVSLYVIVTMVDVFVISIPLFIYVAALSMGALLVSLHFIGNLPQKEEKLADNGFKPMVFHVRRHPMM